MASSRTIFRILVQLNRCLNTSDAIHCSFSYGFLWRKVSIYSELHSWIRGQTIGQEERLSYMSRSHVNDLTSLVLTFVESLFANNTMNIWYMAFLNRCSTRTVKQVGWSRYFVNFVLFPELILNASLVSIVLKYFANFLFLHGSGL